MTPETTPSSPPPSSPEVHDALERQEDVAGEPVLVTGAIEGQGEDALGALLVDLG